jgi:dynein intermediate chain 1
LQAAPKNIARFNMKERTYKFEPMVDQTIVHYATDGWLLHKGSEEAKKQVDLEKMEQEASQRFNDPDKSHGDRNMDESEGPDDSKQLRNQFNFSERAAQTTNYPLRDRETYTEPPPTATVSGQC